MPPAHPRRPRPQTDRCRFVDSSDQRCRRIATIGHGLCRQHAVVMDLDLDASSSELVGALDRVLAGHGRDPLATMLAGALNGILGRVLGATQQRARSSPPPSSRQQPPQARRPAPPQDPLVRAREILGFEPQERLTVELVQARKKALARVFHPDMAGGSEARMKLVNTAADALLAKLS